MKNIFTRGAKPAFLIGAGVIVGVLLWSGPSMRKAQSNDHGKRLLLYAEPGQSVSAFVALNKSVPLFQSPLHPAVGGGFVFHDIAQLTVTGRRLDSPLIFQSLPPWGSAVVDLNTYDVDRQNSNEEVVKRIAFRPGTSGNSVEITRELVRQFFQMVAARPDCKSLETRGSRLGKLLIEKYSAEWPRDVLSAALADPKVDFYAAKTVHCGGVKLTFEVTEPAMLNSAPMQDRGFDVTIYVEAA